MLTAEQALAMLPDGDYIHTFANGGYTLIGTDWTRQETSEAICSCPCELAGEVATDMGHGLVVWRDGVAFFVATRKEAPADA